MPESRDRLARPVDIAAVYAKRRAGILSVLSDEEADLLGSPLRRLATLTSEHRLRRDGVVRRGNVGSRSVIRRARSIHRYQVLAGGNSPSSTVLHRTGRRGNHVLPSWYPRSPLRDVTAVVRAIERRRTPLGNLDNQLVPDPLFINLTFDDPSGAQLKYRHIESTPKTLLKIKSFGPALDKVSRILDGIAYQSDDEQGSPTPEKKLLHCIDTVEKVVYEELQKLKRTANAQKVEREKRVRTLMSMR